MDDIKRRDLLLTGTVVAAAAAAVATPALAQTPAPAGNARSNIQAGDELIP
jgi:hypothetical protein